MPSINKIIPNESGFSSEITEDYIDNNHYIVSHAYNQTRTFVNSDPSHTIRSEYNRADYDYRRPSESVPDKPDEIIKSCMRAYSRVGIIRNVVDLMSDFGCQGIRLQHKNKKIERFYKKWFKKVRGKERSERFLNYLYRCGQVYIYRSYAQLTLKQKRELEEARAIVNDIEFEEDPKLAKRQIPLRYTFINPVAVEVVAPELCGFMDKPVLCMRTGSLKSNMLSRVQKKADDGDVLINKALNNIPKSIRDKISDTAIYLEDDRIEVFYYKKDDWRPYAEPFIYPILSDIITLEKMKLADISALDGAVSNIRLWTIGDIENKIFPKAGMINKLRDILSRNTAGGVMDLVWGPELKMQESRSEVYKWLGSDKYKPILDSIYEGLGIPPVLRSGGGTNTSSFLSMKTLVERLNYGRERLKEFWEKEIRMVQKSCGISEPAHIVFDHMSLSDEVAMTQLVLNMWDRDIVPTETVIEMIGRNPEVEEARTNVESRKRGKSKPYKASPFHNANFEQDIKKLLVQGGTTTPSEVGVKINERKEGEVSRNEQMEKMQMKLKDFDPKLPSGRPDNVQETIKRKPKPTEKPSSNAGIVNYTKLLWASTAIESIGKILSPGYLQACGKSNMRQLTGDEYKEFEDIRYLVLCNFSDAEYVDEMKVMDKVTKTVPSNAVQVLELLKNEYKSHMKRELTIEEVKNLQAISYCLYMSYIDEVG